MDKQKNRVALFTVIRYINRQLNMIVALESLSGDDQYLLNNLHGAIQVLMSVAEENHDTQVYALAEDFEYAVNHIGLAPFKAKSALCEALTKVESLERSHGTG